MIFTQILTSHVTLILVLLFLDLMEGEEEEVEGKINIIKKMG